MSERQIYRNGGKRALDVFVAAALVLLLLPLAAIIYFVLCFHFGPQKAFFSQLRPGKDGKPFFLMKFRSMSEGIGPSGKLKPDAERLTRFGKVLRRLSLDELPQLVNVLRGDMSLIGPRPLLMEYLPRYSPEQARRHEVRPGITGLAQVSGRNLLSWEARFERDVWYVDHLSFALDLRILLKTMLHVVKGTGVRSQSSATMEEFTGSRSNDPRSS